MDIFKQEVVYPLSSYLPMFRALVFQCFCALFKHPPYLYGLRNLLSFRVLVQRFCLWKFSGIHHDTRHDGALLPQCTGIYH